MSLWINNETEKIPHRRYGVFVEFGRMCHCFQKPTQDREFISQFVKYVKVKIREHRRGNQKWTIQRNWQHRVHNTKNNKTKTQHNVCWTPHYVNNTNNVFKITWSLLQTTGGKDEPNIVFIAEIVTRKSGSHDIDETQLKVMAWTDCRIIFCRKSMKYMQLEPLLYLCSLPVGW